MALLRISPRLGLFFSAGLDAKKRAPAKMLAEKIDKRRFDTRNKQECEVGNSGNFRPREFMRLKNGVCAGRGHLRSLWFSEAKPSKTSVCKQTSTGQQIVTNPRIGWLSTGMARGGKDDLGLVMADCCKRAIQRAFG
jgi:hypothetical protein